MEKYDVVVAECPARRLVGIKVQTTMAKAAEDCPAIWDVFGRRMDEAAAPESACKGSFGVCVMLNAEDFDYWAALEADPSAAVPQGMAVIELPAGLYAKAAVPNLEKLGEAYTFLYEKWLKEQTAYACDEAAPSFEWYPPDWQPSDALEVFMAVRKL